MKASIKNLLNRRGVASRRSRTMLALITTLGLILARRASAQTFTVLHSFMATSGTLSTNSDGAYPAGLILSGSALYGNARGGGKSGNGTLFTINTNGTGFANLHSFTATDYLGRNSDGASPNRVILEDGVLYGTATLGGMYVTDSPRRGNGTVFKVNTDGTGFTVLHSFTATSCCSYSNPDGATSVAGLVLSGNTLYGTAPYGGSHGYGTVFAVNTDGTGFTAVHSFAAAPDGTNSEGTYPNAGVIVSGDTLSGPAYLGGSSGVGTVFSVSTNGAGFTTLYSFTGGGDGAYPFGGLILSGNTLYGTAQNGGSSGNGTVFSLSLPQPPVARCKNVTVSADANCTADASLDDGSLDPDGDTITLIQSPPGPYPLGDTSVTLTVTDNHGASDSCTATVTVVDTTSPVISCPDNIVADATGPAGAVVSFAPTASDNCTQASVISSPPSGSTFAIGDTTVFCTATDAAGNQAACSFTMHVRGAGEQINGLIALVQSLGLQSGIANSLIAKLQSAASALDRASIEALCNNLGTFLHEADAQKGKALTAAQAGLLVVEAPRIRAVVGCP